MSLSENPHEPKPLTMSAEVERDDRAAVKHYVKLRSARVALAGTGTDAERSLRAWDEIDALRAALAEAQRERDEARRLVVGTAMHGSKCAYCGALVKIEDMNNFDGISLQLRRHAAKCPKHPMRAVEHSLAAAQLNARTLREALARIHQAHYYAAYSHGAQKLAVYDCMAKWAHEAYASAPADEAALRQWGEQVATDAAEAVFRAADEAGAGRDVVLAMQAVDVVAIVNAALGAPETHAKEG